MYFYISMCVYAEKKSEKVGIKMIRVGVGNLFSIYALLNFLDFLQ